MRIPRECHSNTPVEAMLDSGSSATVMSAAVFEKSPREIRWSLQATILSFKSAQNQPLETLGQVQVYLDIQDWIRYITVYSGTEPDI